MTIFALFQNVGRFIVKYQITEMRCKTEYQLVKHWQHYIRCDGPGYQTQALGFNGTVIMLATKQLATESQIPSQTYSLELS